MPSTQATSEPAPEPRPGPTGISLLLGPANEVRNDQEIAGKTHPADHGQLIGQTLVIGACRRADLSRRRFGEAQGKPRFRLLAQKVRRQQAVWHRVVRQMRFTQAERDIAAPGNLHRICQRLRQIGKQQLHLGRRAQILLFAVQTRTTRISEGSPLLDANPRLVRIEIEALSGTGPDASLIESAASACSGPSPRAAAWPISPLAAARQRDQPAGERPP
jgi:hypothetical protein